MQMEADRVTADHIGVFSRQYRPKNKPICYCFYATIKGQVPEAKGGKWIDYISDANDVLEKKVTRSEAHFLPSSIIDKLPETSPPKERKGSLGSWHQMCLCNSLFWLCLQTPAHHLPIIANLCQHIGTRRKRNYYSTLFHRKKMHWNQSTIRLSY